MRTKLVILGLAIAAKPLVSRLSTRFNFITPSFAPIHQYLPPIFRTVATMAENHSVHTPESEAQNEPTVDCTATKAEEQKPEEKKLPPLSPQDFRIYNHMADGMEYYHNRFRQSWTTLYKACEDNARPSGMSIRQYMRIAEDFCSHLTLHHNIEEAHIFPILAEKMPAFRHEMEMKTAHKAIHEGLEKMEAWLEQVRRGERDLILKDLKEIMDTFGDVLWSHLNDEVEQLSAENMRKFWTVQEMRRMPM